MVAERTDEQEENRRSQRVRARRPGPRPALRIVEPLPLLERVRADALPEHTPYVDSGCELSPSCLRCPLVRCKYDEPGGARVIKAEARAREVVRTHRIEGASITQLAERFGMSRRQVFRALRSARERGE